MERKLNKQEIDDILQRITDAIRQRYFKGPVLGLGPVKIQTGKPKSLYGEYNLRGYIELSYEWVSSEAMCRLLSKETTVITAVCAGSYKAMCLILKANGLGELQEECRLLMGLIIHELGHCLVHRGPGQSREQEGYSKWNERDGHSNWFLFYAYQLRLEHGVELIDLSGIHNNEEWRETKQISADIEQGYHPSQDWQEWRKKKAENDSRRAVGESDSVSLASANEDEDYQSDNLAEYVGHDWDERVDEPIPPDDSNEDRSTNFPGSWWSLWTTSDT